jgi:MFS family permease
MAEKIERQGLTWRHAGVVFTCMVALFTCVAMIFICAGLCYRPVAEHFGVEVSDVSFYITCVYIGSTIAPIPAARLFERIPPKIFFTIALALTCIPYFFNSMWPSVQAMQAGGVIIGLGLATLEYTMTAGMLSRWFHTNYGTVIGLSFACTGAGGITWNLVGQFILGADLSGWGTLYQTYAIIMGVACLICIWLFLDRTPEVRGLLPFGMPLAAEEADADGTLEAPEEPGFTFAEAARQPFFYTMLLGAGCLNIVTTISQLFATYVQFLGHEGWGGQAIVALLLLSGTLEACASAGQMVGKILVGIIESRSLLAAQIMGVCGGVIGILMIWQAPKMMGEGGIYIMFAGGAVYGLMYACSTAMLPFLVRECFGGKDYDRIYSLQVALFNLLGGFGATAWAVLMQTYGWDVFFIFCLGEVIVTFILIAYTGIAAYRKREQTWYVSDSQMAHEA